MLKRALPLCGCVTLLALSACGRESGNEANANGAAVAEGEAASKTIAAGIDQNGRFFQAAKSVGLDATLAGPGPYTVFVPADQALAALPTGDAAEPQARAQVTAILTNHILPGTVLVEDIGKAIENGSGKAALATMGGGTLTATREGDTIVLTDPAGGKATVTQADQRFTNGVVHTISGVLRPQQAGGEAAGAAGQQPAG